MISSTQQTFFRLDNLNAEQERISYQLSTGKNLQYGSDDSSVFSREVYIEDKIRVYEGIKSQLEKTNAQNDGADTTLGEVKDLVSYVKAKVIESLTDTTNDDTRALIATNLEGVKSTIFTFANEQIEGEYIFAGSDSSIPAFVEDETTGKITYNGDNQLRKVVVEDGAYRDRGVNGYETFLYTSSSALKNETLTFSETDVIVNQYGNEWKLETSSPVTSGNTITFDATQSLIDGDGVVWNLNGSGELEDGNGNTIDSSLVGVSGTDYYVNVDVAVTPTGTVSSFSTVQLVEYDSDGNASGNTLTITGSTPDDLNVVVPSEDGTKFEAKASIFDLLDNIINSLNKVDSTGSAISSDEAKSVLEEGLTSITEAYDGLNSGHTKLGGRNNIFDISYERISSKVFQYESLQQEVSGVDLAKVASEAKALELTYTALYSTINRMNELSLVNFIK